MLAIALGVIVSWIAATVAAVPDATAAVVLATLDATEAETEETVAPTEVPMLPIASLIACNTARAWPAVCSPQGDQPDEAVGRLPTPPDSALSGMTASGDEGSGTPQFMPKEQLTDFRSTKPVSDVFGLGAALYNMLTGKFVYDFSASADPCVAILHDRVVPVSQRGVSLPAPLSQVVDRATAPDFRNRYQTVREFSDALLAALNATA